MKFYFSFFTGTLSGQSAISSGRILEYNGWGMTSDPTWSHRADNRNDVRSFLESGYTVFATTHGSQPKYNVDKIRGDIHRAVRFIRYNSKRCGINPSRLGIIGYYKACAAFIKLELEDIRVRFHNLKDN